jgi:lipoate-protein ligase A
MSFEETLKLKMTSVKEILGRVPATDELTAAIRNGMTQALGIEFREGELSSEELSLASKIVNQYAEEEYAQGSNYLNQR